MYTPGLDKITIESKVTFGASLLSFSQDEVKNEPMFYRASLDYAMEHGGPITKNFITSFLEEKDITSTCVLSSRVHMLMPNWYPCIPGYHHDDVPRIKCKVSVGPDPKGYAVCHHKYSNQPYYLESGNYHTDSDGRILIYDQIFDFKPYRANHVMALQGADVSRTVFAQGTAQFPVIHPSKTVYKEWHPLVEEKILSGDLVALKCPMSQLVYFDDRSWHQGVPSSGNGWRWFGRITWYTDDSVAIIKNEIRKQVNVYMDSLMDGW